MLLRLQLGCGAILRVLLSTGTAVRWDRRGSFRNSSKLFSSLRFESELGMPRLKRLKTTCIEISYCRVVVSHMSEVERSASDAVGQSLIVRDRIAVILVDYQPAYVEAVAQSGSFDALPEAVQRLLARARDVLSPAQIIHVRANYSHVFAQNFKLLNPDKPLPADVGATEWAASEVGEKIVCKSSFDAFCDTDLDAHLRALGVNRIIVAGVLTSICVLFSAQSAFARGFKVTVYTPACADRDQRRHQTVVDMYGGYCFDIAKDLDRLLPPNAPMRI